jgi:diguanylate cyclase (GGDEF)-like protein
VAAEHLDEFEARSAEMLRTHMSASIRWKLLDETYVGGLEVARPVIETMLVGALLWLRSGIDLVPVWTIATLLAIAGRALLCASYRRNSDHIGIETWRSRFVASACVEGALWGALCPVILFSSDPVTHLIVAAAVGNRLCEAVACSSGEPRAGFGQVILVLVPLVVCCICTMQSIYIGYAALMTVQAAAATVRIRQLHRKTAGLLNANATVAKTNSELEQVNRKLAAQATTDPLTRLNNRAGFDGALRREWGRAIREHRPLTVMLMQVDQLAAINERCGTGEGDECLRRVADALQLTLRRTTDVAARYGVEEFAVVLPDTDRVAAHYLGERICAAVATLGIASPLAEHSKVTVSIGHSTDIPAEVLVPSNLVTQADTALRRAKATGKGCSCAWDQALDAASGKSPAQVQFDAPPRPGAAVQAEPSRGLLAGPAAGGEASLAKNGAQTQGALLHREE